MRTKLEIALRRRRWRAGDAEIVLSALTDSGCTVAEFARRHGCQAKRLLRWRERLSNADAPGHRGEAAMASIPLLPVQVRGVASIPLASSQCPPGMVPTLDVSVGRGVVHVPRDFDDQHLHRVLVVLAASC